MSSTSPPTSKPTPTSASASPSSPPSSPPSTPTSTSPQIKLVPWPGENGWPRGRKRILVDGVIWGSIHMEAHGVHGVSYWFKQEGGSGPLQQHSDIYGKTKDITVRSGNARKRRIWNQPQLAPIEQRLIEKVRELVANGTLLHPDEVEREQAAAAARYMRKREAEETEQVERDLERARKLIADWRPEEGPTAHDYAMLAQAIAETFAKIRSEP